jgi:hypothetical protein
MSPSETPGSQSVAFTQFLHRPRWPSTFSDSLGTSNVPHPPILVEESHFEAYLRFAFAYNLPTCSPPCRSRPGFHPAYGDFYIRASSGLVTRTAAGYDYSGNWASSTGGTHCLTPARPPTSIAATENRDYAASLFGGEAFRKLVCEGNTRGGRVNQFNPRGESPGPMRQEKRQDNSQTTYYHPHLRLPLCYPN